MNKRLKVLMVGPSLHAWGGVATVENNILKNASSLGCDFEFVATTKDGSKLTKLAMFPRSLIEIQRKLGYCDVCHIHMALGMSYRRKYYVCKAALKADVPYIVHVHEGDFVRLFEKLSLGEQERVRWMLESASRVIVLSKQWSSYFKDTFSLNNLYVLENAVDIPEPKADCKNQNHFFYLGRMCPKKGIDVLLNAVKELRKDYPEIYLYLAGGGERLEEYKHLALDMGITDHVFFLGWADQKEKDKLMDECLTTVLPSRAEGLPMSILEAMASGCAAVATRVGGLPDLIEDGKNGFLIEPNDAKALASAMAFCMNEPEKVRHVAQRGRSTIEERCSMTAYIDSLSRLYEAISNTSKSVSE